MPLAGTFDVLDFGEILGLLSRRSASGRLLVRAGSMHGTIWLADGRATSAEMGSSASGEVRRRWRNVIEDICFEALRQPRGSFEFQPEDESVVPPGARIRLETVIASGKRRLDMWREVESVIHSFEAVPRLAETLKDDVTIDQERWRVLVAVDGRRSVAALAKRLDIELLALCQMLKPLVESGAVVLQQPEGWLKSLPKVRLDVPGREGDVAVGAIPGSPISAGQLPPVPLPEGIDPDMVISAEPAEGMSIVSVGSTVVDGRVPAVGRAPVEEEVPDEVQEPGRRLFRGRHRGRSAEAGYSG